MQDSILQCIGKTPLVRLRRVAADVPAAVAVKVELQNPGGSVKDRVGLAMISEAERAGHLKPGGTIIEATAGNTGVGLAMVAAVRGYKCIFVLPDKMAPEKIALLKAYGAEVVVTPTSVAPDSPDSYNGVADRLAREIPDSVIPQQFQNPANPEIHRRTTAEEIWNDTDGAVDVFVSGVGTGGTITGVGQVLKAKKPSVRVVAVEPEDSPVLSGGNPGPHKIQGIGAGFVPPILDTSVYDEVVTVSNEEAFAYARLCARLEGIPVGISSGAAIAAAVKVGARAEMKGKTIVVIIPSFAERYLSTALFEGLD